MRSTLLSARDPQTESASHLSRHGAPETASTPPRSRLAGWLRASLREPLLHFFLLGLGLWAVQRSVAPTPQKQLELSADTVTLLERDFTRRTGLVATPSTRAALVREYIDAEILYREALQRGLLAGDVIVRRRLIQKMEFLAEALPELTPQDKPTEQQLQKMMDRDPARYVLPERHTLRHVFVARHVDEIETALKVRAHDLRKRLQNGESAAQLGDPFPRGNDLPPLSANELDGQFGPGFGAAVQRLPLEQWSAAIPSRYGLHLVRVSARQPAQTPSFAAVRERLRADWEAAQREPRKEIALERLWQKYDVRVAGKSLTRTEANAGPAGRR